MVDLPSSTINLVEFTISIGRSTFVPTTVLMGGLRRIWRLAAGSRRGWWTERRLCEGNKRGMESGAFSWRMAVISSVVALISAGLARSAPPDGASGEAASFGEYFEVTWGEDHVHLANGDTEAQLSLDQVNASSFASKDKYLFGYISTGIKLVPGDSAGTVTAYYLSSNTGDQRDELDFEFLGNVSGEPYILQTNIFTAGKGRREQRVYLWFDPTAKFHDYAVLWNHNQIVFYVDDYPIRFFENKESEGIAFPTSQPMGIYASIWNGDSWATRGGALKLNWTSAPFTAAFGNFNIQACEAASNVNCASADGWWAGAQYQTLNQADERKLKWVQQNYMIYDYCYDTKRYSTPPLDCDITGDSGN